MGISLIAPGVPMRILRPYTAGLYASSIRYDGAQLAKMDEYEQAKLIFNKIKEDMVTECIFIGK